MGELLTCLSEVGYTKARQYEEEEDGRSSSTVTETELNLSVWVLELLCWESSSKLEGAALLFSAGIFRRLPWGTLTQHTWEEMRDTGCAA